MIPQDLCLKLKVMLATQLEVTQQLSLIVHAERREMPRWMNVMDLILVAHPTPVSRRLRVFHRGEDSLSKTVLVTICVFGFMSFYILVLLLFFTTVFLFPLVVSAGLILVACLAVFGARVSFGSFVYLWRKLDRCMSSLLMGVSHANSPGDLEEHQHDDGQVDEA